MFKDDDQREISRQRGEFRHFVDKNYVEDDQNVIKAANSLLTYPKPFNNLITYEFITRFSFEHPDRSDGFHGKLRFFVYEAQVINLVKK